MEWKCTLSHTWDAILYKLQYICTQYCVDICNLTVFSDPLSRGVFEQRNEFIIYFTCTHI